MFTILKDKEPKLNRELVRARTFLKQLETLTYNMTAGEMDILLNLNHLLMEAYNRTLTRMPRKEGLLSRPRGDSYAVLITRRKIKRAKSLLQCSSLPNCKPLKWLQQARKARVGAKADKNMKVCNKYCIIKPVYACTVFPNSPGFRTASNNPEVWHAASITGNESRDIKAFQTFVCIMFQCFKWHMHSPKHTCTAIQYSTVQYV